MSNILKELGLDESEIKWYHLSLCRGMNAEWFFDEYEEDKELAKQIDQLCLNCPVIEQCLIESKKTKSYGVWGGVYWTNGKIDKKFNNHKTPADWKKLRKIHGGKNIL